MTPRHAAEFPQGVLEAVAESLEGLRGAEGDGLPVGVAEHEVIDQVVERLALDGDGQRVHRCEVGGREVTGVVNLLELDIACGPVCGFPLTHTSLECAPMCVVEPTWMFRPQPLEKCLGDQPGFVGEPGGDAIPDLSEGVGACAVGAWRFVGAGERAACAVGACGFVGHVRPPGGRGQ
jgi:hypothetical protein